MEWIGFWGSLIGGLLGGIFTFFGVLITLKYQKKEKKREQNRLFYDLRPRLEIEEFIPEQKLNDTGKCDCELAMLDFVYNEGDDGKQHFIYDKSSLNNENLYCVIYKLKNIGTTEIVDFCMVSNFYKTTSIFELNLKNRIVKEAFLNYDAWANREIFVKKGEDFTVKICYLKNNNLPIINPSISMYLHDINGNIWLQNLSLSSKSTGNSLRSDRQTFEAFRDFEKPMYCFKHPEAW